MKKKIMYEKKLFFKRIYDFMNYFCFLYNLMSMNFICYNYINLYI